MQVGGTASCSEGKLEPGRFFWKVSLGRLRDEGGEERGLGKEGLPLVPPCKGWEVGHGSWEQEWGSLDPRSLSPRPRLLPSKNKAVSLQELLPRGLSSPFLLCLCFSGNTVKKPLDFGA